MHNLADTLSLDAAVASVDTLCVASFGGEVSSVREVSVAEILGAESSLVDGGAAFVEPGTLVGDGFFQAMAVLLLVVIISFTARHKRQIVTMLGRMFRGRLPEDYSAGRREEMLTRSFLQESTAIGALLVILLLTKYAMLWLPQIFDVPTGWEVAVAMACSLAGIVAIGLFEQGLLALVGAVTRSADIVGALIYLKRVYFAIAAIVMSPAFLLGILSADKLSDLWNILLLIECAFLVLMFIKETITLFIQKKIPILHWILYLCAVEVFPMSLIWALTMRS